MGQWIGEEGSRFRENRRSNGHLHGQRPRTAHSDVVDVSEPILLVERRPRSTKHPGYGMKTP